LSTNASDAANAPATGLEAFGRRVMAGWASAQSQLDFLGATLLGLRRLVRGGSSEARVVFRSALQQAGLGSLPIVALMGWAAGFVLTLLGSKELGKIGVDVGVPRLVGVVILRELAGLITGVALAGRVASSFAAEIACANAGGDADALRARGLDPVDVQVAPRVLALLVAAPLLLGYTNVLAIVGSASYSGASLAGAGERVASMLSALTLKHAVAGLAKAAAFGLVVGLCGCYCGQSCGGGSTAVGHAVRRAVVSAVIGIGVAELGLIFVFKWIWV
jgi:phospholipid/cholesterol/gamma-HCH transport system permease protein